MPIFLKLSPRVQLVEIQPQGFSFTVDGKKNVTFHTTDPYVQSAILNFVHHGGIKNELKTNLANEKRESKFIQFVNSLELNYLIDIHFDFGNTSMKAIATPVNQFTIQPQGYITGAYKLSRFAYFCSEKNNIILKSPIGKFEISFSGNLFIHIFPKLFLESDFHNILDAFPNHTEEILTLVQLLIDNNILQPVNSEEENHLKTWEFHDLLFHTGSRRNRSNDDTHFGATNRFQNTNFLAPSTSKRINSNNSIKLAIPNQNELTCNDDSFSKILEERKSHRVFNHRHPINLDAIGEFLYRSIAIREIVQAEPQNAVFRTYPAAGAIHELECYIVVNKSEGLQRGIYYYDPSHHVLEMKNNEEKYIKKTIIQATKAMGSSANQPQLLIVLTSQFKKIAWKYERMAYRSTLISLGCLFQTMSLVATAMHLGSCIVGSGDSNLFAEALNMSALQEGAVGEFALGTL